MKPTMSATCDVCCSFNSFSRLALAKICCSTLANCTSCEVNSVASIGSSGSWFSSWVMSRVRKRFSSSSSLALDAADCELSSMTAGADPVLPKSMVSSPCAP